jgi:antitoxin component HigA of HigAB toxin-antitoxin module
MNQLTVNNLAEHEVAIARLETLMLIDPPENSAEEEELVALSIVIEAFEKRVFVI